MDRAKLYEFEHSRNEHNLNTIMMVKEGNWYRAYEWSAYLLEFYKGSTAEKPLNPMVKTIK